MQDVDAFCRAIEAGAVVYAHPTTASQMNAHPKFPYWCYSSPWIDQGKLYALKQMYEIPSETQILAWRDRHGANHTDRRAGNS